MNKIFTTFAFVLSINTTALAICPPAENGFTGGCITVEEDHFQPNGKKLNIFYEFFGQKDPNKRTIIFVNGGPGNGLTTHSFVKAYHNLSDQYNVLFYDQRGIEFSDRITEENFPTIDPRHYSTKANVEDLAQLIDQAADGKAYIVGHSYGGSLAYAFGIKYSNKLYGMINIAGTAHADFQYPAKIESDKFYEKFLAQYDTARFNALIELIKQGKAKIRTTGDIDIKTFNQYYYGLKQSYKGQTVDLHRVVLTLLNNNKDLIDQYLANSTKALVEYKNDLKTQTIEYLNPYVLHIITCTEMHNPLYAAQERPEVAAYIMEKYNNWCSEFNSKPELLSVLNYRPQLKNIEVPVLVISASHDLFVPSQIQKADYYYLTEEKNNVHFVTLEKTGHMVFEDSPKCLEKTIREFANNVEQINSNQMTSCWEQ